MLSGHKSHDPSLSGWAKAGEMHPQSPFPPVYLTGDPGPTQSTNYKSAILGAAKSKPAQKIFKFLSQAFPLLAEHLFCQDHVPVYQPSSTTKLPSDNCSVFKAFLGSA